MFAPLVSYRQASQSVKSSVFAWGFGTAALTNSRGEETFKPNKIPAFDSLDVTQIAVSREQCLALTTSNEIYSICLFDGSAQCTKIEITEKGNKVKSRKIVKIACASGSDAFFALTASQEILSWGADGDLLGRESSASQPVNKPLPIKADFRGTDVCVGSTHVLALSAEGYVYSWGTGRSGRLGQGTSQEDERFPSLISGLKTYKIVSISAGWGHSAVLSNDGRVFVWGKNDCGQLGIGEGSGNVDTPKVVRDMTAVRVISVVCGAFHTTFLTELGQVYISGEHLTSRMSSPTLVPLFDWCVGIICGPFHTVAVCQNSTGRIIYSWGKNSSGELGTYSTESQPSPVLMKSVSDKILLDVKFGMNCAFIVALDSESTASSSLSQVNEISKISLKSTITINRNALSRRRLQSSVFSKKTNADAIASSGSKVWVWGKFSSVFNQTNDLQETSFSNSLATFKPFAIKALSDKKIMKVIGCESGFLALSIDGTVYSYSFIKDIKNSQSQSSQSSSSSSQTQSSSSSSQSQSQPQYNLQIFKPKIFSGRPVKSITCNNSVCIAICDSGMVYSWHWNIKDVKQFLLGRDASETDLYKPHPIPGINNAVLAVCGRSHVLLLLEDMQIISWGLGDRGQLGHGPTETSISNPLLIHTLRPYRAVDIAAGPDHSIAIMLDGLVWTWGRGTEGQLGQGNQNDVNVPTQINGLSQIIMCAAGESHTAFLSNRGIVYVCGTLASSSGKSSFVPVEIKMPFWSVSVVCGNSHTVVVCENPDSSGFENSVYSWGTCEDGVLGLGELDFCGSPQVVNFFEGTCLVSATFGCPSFGIATVIDSRS